MVAWICCVSLAASAQSVIREDSAEVPFAQMMDSVFAQVDLNAITSHHLLNRAPIVVPIDRFDGSLSADTADFSTWQSIYASL